MNALIIGRFQPLHLGHIDLIKKTRSLGYNIIIAVGDNGKERTEKYPFVFEEVKQMLETLELSLSIDSVPDINDDSEYAEHVENITGCTSQDTVLVSGNNHTIECFTSYSRNYKVLRPGVDFSIEYHNISATKIRELMQYDRNWAELVTPNVYHLVQNNKGVEKVKHISHHNI